MCFSETQSFLNAFILIIGSIYVWPKYQLSISLIFLALKDLIQGFLYYYQNNKKVENILTSLSWIHICFQPLFVSIFLSYFSQNKQKYWNIIFLISFIYGMYTITLLNEFDIQNDPDCVSKKKDNDFCSTETTSYIGKYHVGYRFSRDRSIIIFPLIYMILLFVPSLFTNSRILGILWIIFASSIYIYFNNVRSGEKAAMWCFLSILYFLPIAIFNEKILNLIN